MPKLATKLRYVVAPDMGSLHIAIEQIGMQVEIKQILPLEDEAWICWFTILDETNFESIDLRD